MLRFHSFSSEKLLKYQRQRRFTVFQRIVHINLNFYDVRVLKHNQEDRICIWTTNEEQLMCLDRWSRYSKLKQYC